jgi:hypothetical protein
MAPKTRWQFTSLKGVNSYNTCTTSLPLVEPKNQLLFKRCHERRRYGFGGWKIIQFTFMSLTKLYFLINTDTKCEFTVWEIGLENLSSKTQNFIF